MSEYRTDRRADAIPALKAVTKNEAATASDLRREQAWERAREAIADERRKKDQKPPRSFAALVTKKK